VPLEPFDPSSVDLSACVDFILNHAHFLFNFNHQLVGNCRRSISGFYAIKKPTIGELFNTGVELRRATK